MLKQKPDFKFHELDTSHEHTHSLKPVNSTHASITHAHSRTQHGVIIFFVSFSASQSPFLQKKNNEKA